MLDAYKVFLAGRQLVADVKARKWGAAKAGVKKLADLLGYGDEAAAVEDVLSDIETGNYEGLLRGSVPRLLTLAANTVFGPRTVGALENADVHPQQWLATPGADLACGVELVRLAAECQQAPAGEAEAAADEDKPAAQ